VVQQHNQGEVEDPATAT